MVLWTGKTGVPSEQERQPGREELDGDLRC